MLLAMTGTTMYSTYDRWGSAPVVHSMIASSVIALRDLQAMREEDKPFRAGTEITLRLGGQFLHGKPYLLPRCHALYEGRMPPIILGHWDTQTPILYVAGSSDIHGSFRPLLPLIIVARLRW